MRLPTFAAGILTLAACGGGKMLLPELGADLTRFGGCGDVILYAVDAYDRVLVTFQAQGFVEEARASEKDEVEVVLDLSATAASARIDYGTRVSSTVCNDVIVPPGPSVDRVWTATAGTATLRVRPASSSVGAFADLRLESVVFSSDGAEDITLEELTWADVFVGWYPG
jgi:hypothetical protein